MLNYIGGHSKMTSKGGRERGLLKMVAKSDKGRGGGGGGGGGAGRDVSVQREGDYAAEAGDQHGN